MYTRALCAAAGGTSGKSHAAGGLCALSRREVNPPATVQQRNRGAARPAVLGQSVHLHEQHRPSMLRHLLHQLPRDARRLDLRAPRPARPGLSCQGPGVEVEKAIRRRPMRIRPQDIRRTIPRPRRNAYPEIEVARLAKMYSAPPTGPRRPAVARPVERPVNWRPHDATQSRNASCARVLMLLPCA